MKTNFLRKIASSLIALFFSGTLLFGVQAALAQTNPSAYTVGKRYNIIGQVTGVITPDPDGSGSRIFAGVRNTYNSQGLLEKVESGTLSEWKSELIKPENWGSAFAITSTQIFTYDGWGRKITESSTAAGITFLLKQYSYDNLGRLDCEAVRMNRAIFNALPASACTLGAAGLEGPDRITKYSYDIKNRITSIVKAYGTDIQQTYASYTYNVFWEKENITDANGNVSKMNYDYFGRLKKWQFPSKTSVGTVSTIDYEEYDYDLNDNRISLRKRDGQIINYQPDNLNRVVLKSFPATPANNVSYNYDNRGLELSSTFVTTNKGIATDYDGFGRIKSSTNSMFTTNKILSYEYDNNSNRTKVTHPDGIKFSYAYDGINKLINVCENGNPAVGVLALRCEDINKEVISPAYDDTARLKSLTLAGGGATNYEYDSISRLDSFTHNLNGSAYDVRTGFTYNSANQVATRTLSNDVFAHSGNQNITGNYTVNGLNQYTAAGGKNFSYDGNSNLTSDGVTTFSYDTENRLISATGAKNATLKYDTKGRLFEVIATINGVASTRQFLYDGDALVAEYDTSGNILNRYVHGSRVDEPYLWYAGNTVSASNRNNLYTDYQGSVVAVTNSSAVVQRVNTYDAYGIPGSNNLGRFSYTGQIYLPEVGLYYYKARIYSPTLGRFLQTDPIGYKDQMNLYAYVGNDPMNNADPTGKYGRGNGFTDEEWKKFNRIQQKAAGKMENKASKMEAKAAKLDAKSAGGGDSLRGAAASLRGGAATLRSDGSDGKIANAVDGKTYQSMGGGKEGGAFVPRGDKNLVYINTDNKAAWNGSQGPWSIGHESLHSTGVELIDQRGSNGEKAYRDGTGLQRDSFNELKGTDKAYINPDNLMDLVF